MKRLLASLILTTAMVALSGCYIDPGYSYVRQNGYQGDAYYGRGVRVYDDGYYYAAPVYGGYYGGGYGYGCCYAPGVTLGISGVWYGDSYYRGGRNGYRGHGNDYRGGQWRGRHDGGRSQDNRRDDRRRSGDRRDRRNGH